jgi:ABC-type branched-subunit amino acid transport system ATPase component
MASAAYVLRRGSIVYSGTSADLLNTGVFEQYLGSEG